MIQAAPALRSARTQAGISQRQLARRAHTSPAAVSRYEAGSLTPSVRTFNRLLEACLSQRRRWPSLAALAPAVARIRGEEGDGPAWRLVGEVLDDEALGTAADTSLVTADAPAPTGDDAVDALMAALAEYLCLRRGVAAPLWVADPARVVRPWWFVAGARAWIPTALRESPRSFAKRGIFVTQTALARA